MSLSKKRVSAGIVFAFLSLAVAVTVFILSAQPSDESAGLSSSITSAILSLFPSFCEADGAAKALETMNERIADQKKTFTDYNQQEKPKLNDAVVMTAGKYAIMCVSSDNAAAEQLITEWLDSKVK